MRKGQYNVELTIASFSCQTTDNCDESYLLRDTCASSQPASEVLPAILHKMADDREKKV